MLRKVLMTINMAHLVKLRVEGSRILINEDLILEDQVELRNGVQRVKEVRKDGKWKILRNREAITWDRDLKNNNKQEFGTLLILSWNCHGYPWNKGPKLHWIPSEIDVIFLFEN